MFVAWCLQYTQRVSFACELADERQDFARFPIFCAILHFLGRWLAAVWKICRKFADYFDLTTEKTRINTYIFKLQQ